LLGFLFTAIITVQGSLSFFDSFYKTSNSVTIGEWTSGPASPGSIIDYVNNNDITIPNPNPGQEDIDISNYISSIIFNDVVKDEEGNILSGIIDPLYEDYTINEIIEAISLIKNFTDNFLVIDSNGNPQFPVNTTVETIDVGLNEILEPGQSLQLNKVFQTADLQGSQDWTPITLQLTIESPVGTDSSRTDMSDYVIEVLADGKPFANTNPFTYKYLYNDMSAYDTYVAQSSGVNFVKNEINSVTSFVTKIYRNNGTSFVPVNYQHTFTKPTFSGSWNRFNVGPNIYVDAPVGQHGSPIGAQQLFKKDSPATRLGLILIGKPNGYKAEILLDIYNRIPANGNSLPVIPLILVVSRGLRLDANGNGAPNQSTSMVQPIIKMRVVKGQIWDNVG
jgi:hypothetical protein